MATNDFFIEIDMLFRIAYYADDYGNPEIARSYGAAPFLEANEGGDLEELLLQKEGKIRDI
ncbi:hypothetical protein GTP46_17095 [Duganella sp. FT135W]|uniref:Uncharacterized protein n=1 Tax=Duganella flavida TaxID=2692175 RepID=A0A6L8KF16_9BURK|nr:hypothetical protein [Duganella flavida]MYM24364.1 hypothetical protein [Duganella flavida]